MSPERRYYTDKEFKRTKGWLKEKRARKREEQERSSTFYWKNDPRSLVTVYRAEVGKSVLTSLRDKLHYLLTNDQTDWILTTREEARRLQKEKGYQAISNKQVYAELRLHIVFDVQVDRPE